MPDVERPDHESRQPAGRVETPHHTLSPAKICFALIGLGMIVASLILCVVIERHNDLFLGLVRTLTALGGGLLAAMLSEFMTVDVKLRGQAIKAGGGFAVFVVLFFFDPTYSAAGASVNPETEQEAEEFAEEAEQAPEVFKDVLRESGFRSLEHLKITGTPVEVRQMRAELNRRVD